jgi:hypothetical protein
LGCAVDRRYRANASDGITAQFTAHQGRNVRSGESDVTLTAVCATVRFFAAH